MKLFITTILMLAAFTARAQMQTPEDYLNSGSQSASSLHQAIMDIQQNLTSINTKETFRSYYKILPNLEALSVQLGFESIHPGAIKNLGEQMTAYGLRWLDISKDDAAIVQQHLQWMNASTANRYVYTTEEVILRSKPEDALLISQNLDLFVQHCTEKYKDDLYIAQAYRELLSELAIKKIQTIPLDVEVDVIYWSQKISNQEALSTYIHYLLEKTYTVGVMTRSDLDHLLIYALSIKSSLDKNIFPVSARTYQQLGEVVLEILDKSLLYLWPLQLNQATEAIGVLSVTQAGSLADRLVASSYQAISDMDENITLYAETLMYRLSILGAPTKAEDFAGIFYSTVPTAVRKFQASEGIYKMKDVKLNTKWIMSFVRFDETRFLVTLFNEKTKAFYTLSDVDYDYESGSFIATQESTSEQKSNVIAKIQFLDGQQASVEVSDAKEGWLVLNGSRDLALPATEMVVATESTKVPTLLSGKIVLQKKTIKIELSVTMANERYIAQMYLSNGREAVLEGFFSWVDGNIYFTSNPNSNEELIHLRLKATDELSFSGHILFSNSAAITPVLVKSAE